MIHEDFERLIKLFSEAEAGQGVSLEKAIQEAVALFDNIKESLENASPEEKKVLMEELNQMHTLLAKETTRVAEKTGMSEEQIMATVDNPTVYTPEQWGMLQNAKDKLLKSGNIINKMIKNPELESPTKNKSKKVFKTSRSDWLRS